MAKATSDARVRKVEIRCPACSQSSRRVETTYDATDVLHFRCRFPQCGRRWQVILRPVRANRDSVIRIAEWVELLGEVARKEG